MSNKIKNFICSWINTLLEKERRRSEMESVLSDHWKDHGPIHMCELIREDWDEETKKDAEKDCRFVVFIDQDIEVDWITKKSLSSEESEFVSYAESIGAKECKQLPVKQQLEIQRLVAQAIVCAIEGNFKVSRKTADLALQSLLERTIERSRLWTLQWVNFGFVMVLFALDFFWSRYDVFGMARWSIFGGAVGAYLSVVQNAGKGKWNSAAGQWVHFIEVGSRLFSGCALGCISFVVILSPLCPKLFEPQCTEIWPFFLFGVMAGFIERLIPRILSSYNDTTKEMK